MQRIYKKNAMDLPFVYGKSAEDEFFTDREQESKSLTENLKGLNNTIIISPRRWGKTSLVNKVANEIKQDKGYYVAQLDIFNCRTEEQFYRTYINAILKASTTKFEEFTAVIKKYLGSFGPKITLSDDSQSYEVGLGIEFKDKDYSQDEILDLPQRLAAERGKRFIICIDEFQNVNDYADPIGFQRKLRAHWQHHSSVGYCLYGSKRHMLLDIFGNYEMPFYKFGEIMFLEKIAKKDWIPFITARFEKTGKHISGELAALIVDKVEAHPYYVQQLAQQAWLHTQSDCTEEIVNIAHESIVNQLNLLFCNLIDSLTTKQINFLHAIADGVTNFSAKKTLEKYDLGSSANIKNLRNAMLQRDLIDIIPGKSIELQDPIFTYWLKQQK